MKQWIREHPWRLEVVPFLILVFAVVTPLVYRTESLSEVHAPLGGVALRWFVRYASGLFIMITLWIIQLIADDNWPILEKGTKTFNWKAVFFTETIALVGSNHAALTMARNGSNWVGETWFILSATVWLMQSLLEWSRPSARQESIRCKAVVKSAQDIQPGDSFYYREVQIGWEWLLSLAITISGTLYVYISIGHVWAALVAFPFFAVYSLSATSSSPRATFVVTNEYVVARMGLQSVKIRIRDIVSYRTEEFEPLPPPPPWKDLLSVQPQPADVISYSGFNLPLRGLLVETLNGMKFLIGFDHPETACRLIQTALAAREETGAGEQ